MIIDIIKHGNLVFDVGANIGNKSKEYIAHGARVVTFEPQEKCADICAQIHGIILERIALDEKKGENTIYEASAHTLSSMSDNFIETVKKGRFMKYLWGKGMKVKTDTLDNMIEKYGMLSYIKIDVEGYELNVLKGLTKPPKYISIEFTPELLSKSLECIDYLEKLGMKEYNYGYMEEKNFKFEWMNKEKIIEYLSSVKDYKIEFGDIYARYDF